MYGRFHGIWSYVPGPNIVVQILLIRLIKFLIDKNCDLNQLKS